MEKKSLNRDFSHVHEHVHLNYKKYCNNETL